MTYSGEPRTLSSIYEHQSDFHQSGHGNKIKKECLEDYGYDDKEGFKNDILLRYHCRKLGFPLCAVKTTLDQVIQHLISDHLIDGVIGNCMIVEQSMLSEPGIGSVLFRPHFMQTFGRLFILTSGYDKYQGLYFWNMKAILYEDEEAPLEFCVKMELFSAYNNGKNIVWQAPVFGLNSNLKQTALSSFVIREEVMPEFQFNETDNIKLNFCAGDCTLNIPGWRLSVSIITNGCDTKAPSPSDTDLTDPIWPVVVVSRLSSEEESETFFHAKKHYGIVCRGCGWENMQGVRYSCVHCSNFNICTFCMKSGVHTEHIMIRIMTPEQSDEATSFLRGLQCGFMDDSLQG